MLARCLFGALAALALCAGCSDDASGGGGAGASGGSAQAGSGGQSGSAGQGGKAQGGSGGGSEAGGGAGAGGAGAGGAGSGGSAGSAGALVCDPGFAIEGTPTAGVPFGVSYSNSTGFAYVDLELSGPGSPQAAWEGVGGNYTWSYTVSEHQAGVLQVRFVRDKNGGAGVAVASCQVAVLPAGAAGAGGSAGSAGSGGSGGLCAPAQSLLEHGGFDEGIENGAPKGWEVRDAAKMAECGPQHLYEEAPAPGCGGKALAVDAQGSWDCYAVQAVTPYNSIEGGATYVIRAVARSEGNAVNPAAWFVVGAQWLDGQDQFFGDEKNPKTSSADQNDFGWRVLEWELVAPPQARRMLVWLSAHYPGKVTFDHVAVRKK